MNKLYFLLLPIMLLSCKKNSTSTDKVSDNTVEVISTSKYNTYLQEGYSIVPSDEEPNIIFSDLNHDGLDDFVALIAENDLEETDNVRLVVYEGTSKNTYTKKTESGNLTSTILFNNTGAVIELTNKQVIKLRHYSMRHSYVLKFRYEKKHENYMLIGSDLYSNSSGTTSTNYLTNNRIKTLDKNAHYNQGLKEDKIISTKLNQDLVPLSGISDENIYTIITDTDSDPVIPKKPIIVTETNFVTAVNGLNVTKNPQKNGVTIAKVNFGDFVSVIDTLKNDTIDHIDGNWLKIKTKGKIGYVFSSFISNDKNLLEYVSFFKKAVVADDKDWPENKALDRAIFPKKVFDAFKELAPLEEYHEEYTNVFNKIIFNKNITGFVIPLQQDIPSDNIGSSFNIIFIWGNSQKEIIKYFVLDYDFSADDVSSTTSWLYDINKDGSLDIVQQECNGSINYDNEEEFEVSKSLIRVYISNENGITASKNEDLTEFKSTITPNWCPF